MVVGVQAGETLFEASTAVSDTSSSSSMYLPHSRKGTAYFRNYKKQDAHIKGSPMVKYAAFSFAFTNNQTKFRRSYTLNLNFINCISFMLSSIDMKLKLYCQLRIA